MQVFAADKPKPYTPEWHKVADVMDEIRDSWIVSCKKSPEACGVGVEGGKAFAKCGTVK